MKARSLCNDLQVWGFEGPSVLFRDNSIGFGLEISSVDVSCMDDENINALSKRIKDFINGLPTGIDFQFVQDISRSNLDRLNEHFGVKTDDPLIGELAASRLAKFEDLRHRGEPWTISQNS